VLLAPVLVFDGDCAFCSSSARFVAERLRRSPADYRVEPWQQLDLDTLGLTPAECDEAVRWVGADGIRDAGYVAIARALLASRWWVRPAGAVLLGPGVRAIAARTYPWVAANRHRLPGGTAACAIPPVTVSTTGLDRQVRDSSSSDLTVGHRSGGPSAFGLRAVIVPVPAWSRHLKAGAMSEPNASSSAVSPGAQSFTAGVKPAWVTTTRLRSGTTRIRCPKLPLAE
jgi:predicted DCC family thiol-disulfide oxidoreductase YuxK